MAKLIFVGEKFGGRVYKLAAEKTTVGRGDHNTLTIRDSSVSQAHCEILVCGPEVIVRDLGSSNGTFVNGERLHSQQRQLKSGQIVKFGSVEALLELDLPSSDDTAFAETAIFSHVRHMREPPKETHKPQSLPTTLESGSESNMADHTIVLPRSSQVKETTGHSPSAKTLGSGKPQNRITLAIIVAFVFLGLLILVWIIRGRQ